MTLKLDEYRVINFKYPSTLNHLSHKTTKDSIRCITFHYCMEFKSSKAQYCFRFEKYTRAYVN